MKTVENPVTEEHRDGTITKHPAFAQIGISRVTGRTNLYGSDFQHQHYITITICRSDLHRHLNRDWNFGQDELIKVALSEAQWATFVSSPNIGSGVPCTLTRLNGQLVPELPNPPSTDQQFRDEIAQNVAKLQADLKKLASEIDGPIAKTKASEMRKRLERLADRMVEQTGFVAEQFDQHIERTVETAKVEINAYATSSIYRAGIEAMAGGLPAITYDPASGDPTACL